MNVTTTFLLSLNQDIHILNKLVEEITKTYEVSGLTSWLFPSKSQDFLTKRISNGSLKNASYENCLEVTLDRLYVLINFFLRYMETSKEAPRNALIYQPRKSTLGFCVKLLWDNIVKIMEKEITKKTAWISPNHNSFNDQQTQTEIISLNTCDSCSSAILCMKRLLKSFDNQQDRVKIKYQIFDITQFGCMLKVTSSIEDALNNLYTQLHQEKSENKSLKLTNENIKGELQERSTRIAFLEEEVNVLRRQLEKDTQDVLTLKQEQSKLIKDITTKKSRIDNLEETVDKFTICLQSITKENSTLKSENDRLKSNAENSVQLLSRCNKVISNKLLRHDRECDVIKSIIKQYEKSLAYLNIKLVKITKNVGKAELKLTNTFEDMGQVFQHFLKYESFCMKTKDLFKAKLNNSNDNTKQIPAIKGNPVEDISKQIEENKSKIQNLKSENVKLQKLLCRFVNIQIT